MSDLETGAASAAAETIATPEVVDAASPLSVAPQPKPEGADKPAKGDEQPKEKPSARDAIKAAREKIAAQEKAEATEKAKPVETGKKPDPKASEDKAQDKGKASGRDETGKFKAKEGEDKQPARNADQGQQPAKTRFEAPKRFSADAQRDWETAPESVRAEVHRALRENEEGISKYKTSHERYETFREFDETAKKNGRELRDSIHKLVEFERAMTQNPLAAINYALREAGPRAPDGSPITIDDIVAHVAGKSVDERVAAVQSENQQLRAHIARMQGEQRTAQAVNSIPNEVDTFAKENPRFEELADVISTLIETDTAKDLATAYKLAVTLRPESAGAHTPEKKGAHTPAKDTDEDLSAQTQKGGKSITGAPTVGSDLTKRQPSQSIKESLRRALVAAG